MTSTENLRSFRDIRRHFASERWDENTNLKGLALRLLCSHPMVMQRHTTATACSSHHFRIVAMAESFGNLLKCQFHPSQVRTQITMRSPWDHHFDSPVTMSYWSWWVNQHGMAAFPVGPEQVDKVQNAARMDIDPKRYQEAAMKKACNATLQCLRNVGFEIIQHVKNTKLNTQTRDKSRTCFVLPHLQLSTFMVESSFEHGKLVILGLEVVCSDYGVEASTLVERRGMKVNRRLSQGGRSIPYFPVNFLGVCSWPLLNCSILVGSRPLDGGGVLLTLGGLGGACINVHVNLQMKYTTLWLPAGACIHGWGGVGWDNNVHGPLFHWACYATLCSLELCTHGSCYGTVCSLELCSPASCYATVCCLELCIHSSCYAIVCFLGLCAHASCYAIVCSLELCTHAAVLYVLLNFCTHAAVLYVLLNFCTHGSCYAPLRDTICAHVVLAFKLIESRSSKVLGRSGGAALTKKRLKTCDDELVSGWPENAKMVVSWWPLPRVIIPGGACHIRNNWFGINSFRINF